MRDMALYIHVPFCRHKCNYCDFYSTTDASLVPGYLSAVIKEIERYQQNPPFGGFLRSPGSSAFFQRQQTEKLKDPLPEFLQKVQAILPGGTCSFDSIYFGGGTPSLLSHSRLFTLLRFIRGGFQVHKDVEITLEANPGTLTESSIMHLHDLGINRISLGVQSFDDRELKTLSRIHDARQAENTIRRIQRSNLNNISIDLIFAIPGQTLTSWRHTLNKALFYHPQHISMYGLTYESGTALAQALEKQQVKKCEEELEREMHLYGMETLTAAGYEHYEISNFALPHYRSRHNQKYWDGTPYLGLGPSAHSYIDRLRWSNTRSVDDYVQHLLQEEWPIEETEELSLTEMKAETILLGLRRKEGVSLSSWQEMFREDLLAKSETTLAGLGGTDVTAQPFSPSPSGKLLTLKQDHLALTRQGLLLYDYICREIYAAVA